MSKNPCSICEKYIKGVRCDDKQCPVYLMKQENARLKRELSKADTGFWKWEEEIQNRTYEMGEC